MIPGTEHDDLVVRVEGRIPPGWDELLAACSAAEFFATRCWTELAAKHYPSGRAVWASVELAGVLVGGVPLVARRRRGVVAGRRRVSREDAKPRRRTSRGVSCEGAKDAKRWIVGFVFMRRM